MPRREEIAALLPLVNAAAVSVRNGTVFLRRAGMELDLGGVGKEYAVDRAARGPAARGIRSAIVDFAGDVRTIGSRGDGRPWRVGVMDPRDRDRCRFTIRPISGAGIATSGDYERGFVKDGVRYHHILDATTGWPARGLASATVVASVDFRGGPSTRPRRSFSAPRRASRFSKSAPGIEGALITEDWRNPPDERNGVPLGSPRLSLVSLLRLERGWWNFRRSWSRLWAGSLFRRRVGSRRLLEAHPLARHGRGDLGIRFGRMTAALLSAGRDRGRHEKRPETDGEDSSKKHGRPTSSFF